MLIYKSYSTEIFLLLRLAIKQSIICHADITDQAMNCSQGAGTHWVFPQGSVCCIYQPGHRSCRDLQLCINSAAEKCLTYIWTNLILSLEGISRHRVRGRKDCVKIWGRRKSKCLRTGMDLEFPSGCIWSLPTFLFPWAKFWRGSMVEEIPLGYYNFWCILFWKEGAFCLGDREMKQISFREAVLVPNFCIVKAQN